MPAMDDIDLRIIQELVANSRVTYRELAGKLGLSVNSVHKRVQHMTETGMIQQFTFHLTTRVVPQVWVRVCGASATKLMDETVEKLGKNPNTSMVAVSSNNTLHVVGVLRDFAEISRFVNFVVRTGEIAKPDVRLPNPRQLPGIAGVSLTDTDYKILAALQGNCRKQIVDVATELGLATKTVRRRLERMEKNELISYGIKFDHSLLGGTFTLLDMYVKSGVDAGEVQHLIRNKYSKNLMSLRTFSTLPDEITVDVWTRTMTDLKVLQDSLQKEGVFERIVPILVYHVNYFDTWRDDLIREKAKAP
ncbi:MAG TPA: winged helix-turn-helix transcriptional regulator [Methanocella sp.]|jgi:DNA-binding Lrp family transcriptional regulator